MAGHLPMIGDLGAAAAQLATRVRDSVVEVSAGRGGIGAGVIWGADGTIVTNHHVATHDSVLVTLADGRSTAGAVVARDPDNDLAVLKARADGLSPASIGNARQLRAGELVLAIGHPFGIRGAMTIGVVQEAPVAGRAAGARELIRADVLLGPGNSGGPLIDARGRVVGINAMVAGGLALAVPSHLVEPLLGAGAGRFRLGVEAREVELTPLLAARAPGTGRAVLVVGVAPGSAAERAGLIVGDVLVAVAGQAIDGVGGLASSLAAHGGGPVMVGLLRGGVPREVVATNDTPTRQAA